MNAPQQASPPQLSGYQHVRVLGKGGFAYVFLYEQDFPRAEVAIKVLNTKLAEAKMRAMFLSEANLMSQLKSHPSVLTVHAASIAPDGRPYLVMEYCPASLGSRYKQQPLTVSEVLQTGIRIGGALETAHRIGFLHRDIKPSNILVTQYGHPVLADFGIAATIAAATNDGAEGMSVPWSAPEVLRGTTAGTVTSEVYALAATLFTLLLGRSPYELPDDSKYKNRRERVRARIVGRDRVQPLGRRDVPPDLEALLVTAMSKNPTQRPQSMISFVYKLQEIEAQLGFPPTPIEVADDVRVQQRRHVLTEDLSDDVLPTRVALRGEQQRYRHHGDPGAAAANADVSLTVIDSARIRAPHEASLQRTRKRRMLLGGLIGGGAVLLTVLGIITLALGSNSDIPVVSGITTETHNGVVVFNWDAPGDESDLRYLVRTTGGDTSNQSGTQYRATAQSDGEPVCITVTVIRDGTPGVTSPETCASAEVGR
ncbi:serine/threonine-protein kinase [Lysinibacter sp. HNR]|uniref:serine/threonine-protein kinase n=1 Tax=Lysinibacter sp. HNR TaxID=3031408 RepID=UPI002435E995|nr:serine/threonine-protein kinase [Lysinibacter sp. HNR]WGD37985.1 serine/threonine-protein kinase [Lysinibacter sp. HNR]